jgi:hypothetical protein
MCRKFGGRIACRDRYELWDDAISEESMVKDVMQRGALLRVGHKNLLHKLARIRRDISARWELVLIITNAPEKGTRLGCKAQVSTSKTSLINFFDVLGLEGWTADDKRVYNDPDGPGINLEAASVCRVEQYLQHNIIRCSTNGLLPFAGTLDKCGNAKATNLDTHVRIEEKIVQFQIKMDHLVGMHVMASADELYHKEPRLWPPKDATAIEHAHERPILVELQSHIDILLIFEAIDKSNDVAMV